MTNRGFGQWEDRVTVAAMSCSGERQWASEGALVPSPLVAGGLSVKSGDISAGQWDAKMADGCKVLGWWTAGVTAMVVDFAGSGTVEDR